MKIMKANKVKNCTTLSKLNVALTISRSTAKQVLRLKSNNSTHAMGLYNGLHFPSYPHLLNTLNISLNPLTISGSDIICDFLMPAL
jgi:hypothetical protein